MLEWSQPHPVASFPDAAVAEHEIDKPHKPRPETSPRTPRGTSSSGSRPEQSQSPMSRPVRPTLRCYRTRLHETDISRVPSPCKRLRDECPHPANRDHARQVCSETS